MRGGEPWLRRLELKRKQRENIKIYAEKTQTHVRLSPGNNRPLKELVTKILFINIVQREILKNIDVETIRVQSFRFQHKPWVAWRGALVEEIGA